MASRQKATMKNYNKGIVSALLAMKGNPNPTKASNRGLNEFDIKLYFKSNYKGLSHSWMEQLTHHLESGHRTGWLKYNKQTSHYSINTELFQLIKKNGTHKAFKQYFKSSKKPTTRPLRRSQRIQSRQSTEESESSSQPSPSEDDIPHKEDEAAASSSHQSYSSDGEHESASSSLASDYARMIEAEEREEPATSDDDAESDYEVPAYAQKNIGRRSSGR
eukprot:355183_1